MYDWTVQTWRTLSGDYIRQIVSYFEIQPQMRCLLLLIIINMFISYVLFNNVHKEIYNAKEYHLIYLDVLLNLY